VLQCRYVPRDFTLSDSVRNDVDMRLRHPPERTPTKSARTRRKVPTSLRRHYECSIHTGSKDVIQMFAIERERYYVGASDFRLVQPHAASRRALQQDIQSPVLFLNLLAFQML